MYLSELAEVLVRYLESWVSNGELRCNYAKALVLCLVGIIISHRSLDRLFDGKGSSLKSVCKVFANSTASKNEDINPHNRLVGGHCRDNFISAIDSREKVACRPLLHSLPFSRRNVPAAPPHHRHPFSGAGRPP